MYFVHIPKNFPHLSIVYLFDFNTYILSLFVMGKKKYLIPGITFAID